MDLDWRLDPKPEFCVSRLCMSPNDVAVEEYTAADYDAGDGEYVVERIVAEKKINKRIWYIVKWKVKHCCCGDVFTLVEQ